MKILNALVIAALIGFFAAGCSKGAPKQMPPAQPKMIDFGVVELSNHESQTNDLGDGKNCIVTFTAVNAASSGAAGVSNTNEILISVVIETKDSSGKIRRTHGPRLITISGETCSISDGVHGFTITPKLKTN